ncbi:MAG TPA: four helix bundle protein [Anaerolineales bacterium]|nr:four helix bundle protein [Anaerolineales bacterium]
MATAFEDLRVLQSAEGCADKIWKQVVQWDEFAKDVVGKQMARAMDSIGANIAESFGRFNFGEKLQFLYYARGSLFETKYWLNRAKIRELMSVSDVEEYTSRLTDIAKQLNSFAESLKTQRAGGKTIREPAAEYNVDPAEDLSAALFDESDLHWLQS